VQENWRIDLEGRRLKGEEDFAKRVEILFGVCTWNAFEGAGELLPLLQEAGAEMIK